MGGCDEQGVLLGGLSSLLFSVCSLLAKTLSELHPLQLSCLSSLGVIAVSGATAISRKARLFPPGWRMALMARSFIGTLFLVSSFYSVQLMPLGDASVLFYTAPVFTLLLAEPLLKETSSPTSLLLACLLMVCVVLVVKPPFIFSSTVMSSEYLLGVFMAITASLTDALSNISLRELRTIHFSVVMFNYGVMSFLQTCFISVLFTKWTPFTYSQVTLTSVLVLLNTMEQIAVTLALKFEKAGLVALVQASDIIYGYTFQIIFFNEEFDVVSMFGIITIAIIILVISLNSRKAKDNHLILKC